MLLGVSHDLRTPLTRAQLGVYLLQEHEPELVRDILDDLEEMNKIIEQFIVFVRHGVAETPVNMDVTALVREIADNFKGIQLHLPETLLVPVSPVSFSRMLTNLISNAEKHGTPPIEVVVENTGSEWSVTVVDRGEGDLGRPG